MNCEEIVKIWEKLYCDKLWREGRSPIVQNHMVNANMSFHVTCITMTLFRLQLLVLQADWWLYCFALGILFLCSPELQLLCTSRPEWLYCFALGIAFLCSWIFLFPDTHVKKFQHWASSLQIFSGSMIFLFQGGRCCWWLCVCVCVWVMHLPYSICQRHFEVRNNAANLIWQPALRQLSKAIIEQSVGAGINWCSFFHENCQSFKVFEITGTNSSFILGTRWHFFTKN